jgi:uncharacterized protein (DUF983 family)
LARGSGPIVAPMAQSRSTVKVHFYREVPVDDSRLAIRRFFATNAGLRCPACGLGRVGRGLAGVRDSCDVCGSRYRRLEGNELISISLSFFLASIVTFLVALPLILTFGFFAGVTWLLVGVGVAAVILLQRPTKVLALWLLWMLGFVYPDGAGRGVTEAELPTNLPERAGGREACRGWFSDCERRQHRAKHPPRS